MLNEIFKYILSNIPELAFLIVLVAGTIYLTVKTMKLLERFRNVESHCNSCKTNSFPALNSKLDDIIYSLNSLIVYLKGKDKNLNMALFKSNSPLQLTDLGVEILKACGGKDEIDKNIDLFITNIESKNLQTALDVQEFASILMIDYFNNTLMFNSIKDYMYKNPIYTYKDLEGNERQVSMDIHTVTMVMGIYLRNKYLDRHPELNT